MTQLVMSSLLAAAGRVINVSSEGHRSAKLRRAALEEIMRGGGPYGGWRAYADSKLANSLFTKLADSLFTKEPARRYQPGQLSAVALHPGTLATRIWNRNMTSVSLLLRAFKPIMGKPSVGGEAVVFLAQAPSDVIHGQYYDKQTASDPAKPAHDRELAEELWRVSSQLVGV